MHSAISQMVEKGWRQLNMAG